MVIYWADMPLQDESIRMSYLMNPYYATALKKNLTRKLNDRFKLVAISRQNLIFSSFGVQGTGKSWQMIFLVEKFNKLKGIPMDVNKCCFTLAELLDVVDTLDKGETFMLDEQVYTSGYGSVIERRILENIEMTVREHKLSFFFLAPKYIPHNFHYYLETWQVGNDEPINFDIPLEKQWKYTKSIIFDNKNQPLGYIITGTPEDKDFLEKYEKKKDEHIKEFRSRRGAGRYAHILKRAYQLLEDKDFLVRFIHCKREPLKKLLVIVSLKGELIGTEELKMLVGYCDYLINFDDEIIKKVEKIKLGAIGDKYLKPSNGSV